MKIIKNFEEYIENLPQDDFGICSSCPGSKNLLIVDSEHFKLFKTWITNPFADVPALVLAHGLNDTGKIVVHAKDLPIFVIGKGNKTGFALFIQSIDNTFNIAVCNDTIENHERFFLTATNDKNIAGILLSIIERFCPLAEKPEQILSFIQDQVVEQC